MAKDLDTILMRRLIALKIAETHATNIRDIFTSKPVQSRLRPEQPASLLPKQRPRDEQRSLLFLLSRTCLLVQTLRNAGAHTRTPLL
jgi:hypothetical protein